MTIKEALDITTANIRSTRYQLSKADVLPFLKQLQEEVHQIVGQVISDQVFAQLQRTQAGLNKTP